MSQPAPISYDPRRRAIHIDAKATPYQRAHEIAHAAQHEHQTLLWRLDQFLGPVLIIGRLTRLCVEIQAARLALASLTPLGLNTAATRREARAGIYSYITGLLWMPTPKAMRSAWMDL